MKKRMGMTARACAIVLCLASPLTADEMKSEGASDIKRVDGEGTVMVGDETTMSQAKAAALNNARRDALEKATGVVVHGSSTTYNYQLINDLVIAATKGIIVWENVLYNTCRSKDEGIYCHARIEADVKPLHVERRGSFAVKEASVKRVDKPGPTKNAVFQNNDEIQVLTRVNQDAYVHIFSADQHGNVSKLYPNSFGSQERLEADQELVFPDETLRNRGLKMKVRTPKGVKKSVESILVIATKEKTTFLADKDIENPTITDLMQELSCIDPSLWVDRVVGYEVIE